MKNNQETGMTLIEILVAMVIFIFVILISYNMYVNMSESTARSNQKVKTIQNARTAMDILSNDLSMIGFGIDDSVNPQQQKVCWAGPFQIVFNADLDAGQTGSLAAMDKTQSPNRVPIGGSTILYSPAVSYSTGAETVRYTLDSTYDYLVNTTDHENDYWAYSGMPENQTQNTNTYIIFREIYGFSPSSYPQNGGIKEPIAYGIRGWGDTSDAYPNGDYPQPLFQYWGLFDADPEEDLWGDTDGDGILSNSEISAWLIPVTDAAHRRVTYSETSTDTNGNGEIDTCLDDVLTRIVVTVTAEDHSRDVRFPNLTRSDANGNNRIDGSEVPYYFNEVVMSATIYPRNVILAGNYPAPYISPTPIAPTNTPLVWPSATPSPGLTVTATPTPTPTPTHTMTNTPNCGPPGPLEYVPGSAVVCGAKKDTVMFQIRNTSPSTYVVITNMTLNWYDGCCPGNDWDDFDKPKLKTMKGAQEVYQCSSNLDLLWNFEGGCSNPAGYLDSPAEVQFTNYCDWPILFYENQVYTFSQLKFVDDLERTKKMLCTNFKIDITFDCIGGSIDEKRTLYFTTPDQSNNQTTFIFDPFTDGEDENDPAWYSSKSDDWTIVGDGGPCYSGQNLVGESVTVTGDSYWSDYTVEVEAKLVENYVEPDQSQARSYLAFRYVDDENYYLMQVRNGLLTLGCMSGGSYYISASEFISVTDNTWYRYKVDISMNTINGYVFDVFGNNLIQEISYIDHSSNLQPNGKVGVRVNASMVRYDNFRVSICD